MTTTTSSADSGKARSFNPTRLTAARERRGLTKQALAASCGVTRRTISAWEAGDVENPPVDVLARALAHPSDYFHADDVPEVPVEWVSFRALSSMTSQQTQRVLAAASLAVELSSWIDARYITPSVELTDFRSDAPPLLPATAAEEARVIWRLYERPVKSMTLLLERYGVRIFSLPTSDREVDAFSFWHQGRPFIFLNTAKTAERMRYDLAHELGHLLLHRAVKPNRSRQVEQEADNFATNFLIPADGLRVQITGPLTLEDVFTLKMYWKVSAMAMVQRLWQLEYLTEWARRRWIIELTRRGFRNTEPDGISPEPSKLLTQLFRFAREDGYSARRIARALRVRDNDLDDLVFGLSLSAISGQGTGGKAPSAKLKLVK